MKIPLVLLVAIIALIVWLLFQGGSSTDDGRRVAASRVVTISWLVAQCFMLATAFHYMNRML